MAQDFCIIVTFWKIDHSVVEYMSCAIERKDETVHGCGLNEAENVCFEEGSKSFYFYVNISNLSRNDFSPLTCMTRLNNSRERDYSSSETRENDFIC